jgi:hypothetical protein
VFIFIGAYAQNLPEGYILQYQQNFSDAKSLKDFNLFDSTLWETPKTNGNIFLQCKGNTNDSVSPFSIAVLNNRIFGDFILEASVMAGTDSNGISEASLFLGLKDLTRYYYVQLADRTDSLTNGIFLFKRNQLNRLSVENKIPLNWDNNKWHKVRIERNIVRRTILVYVDNMQEPFIQVKDYELVMGSIGFGSFTSPAKFDNIMIWAPTVIPEWP